MTFLFLAVALAQSPKKDAPPPAADQLKQIASDLKEARGLLPRVTDRATRERLELLITRSELAAAELQKSFAGNLKVASMPTEDFAKLMKSLKGNSFDDGKLAFVKTLGKTARFSSAQAKEILAAFSFDRERVPAAILLHPLVVDPELFFQAIDACTFDSSKREVREKLGIK